MSEKRFTFDYEYEFEIYDKQTKKHYDGTVGCQEKLVDLLNEQQATISALKEENEQLRFALRTEQALARVEKDNRPFLSKEEFLKELENE